MQQVATVRRGGLAESWHHGAAAVVLPGGRLVARAGSESVDTFLRSAAKPFQAITLLENGGAERWGLSPADLALVCSSHQGTPAHIGRLRELLERAGLAVEDLECGAHPPFDSASASRLMREGREPTPLHNNCSGKHVGMLMACKLLDLSLSGYTSVDHPLQRRILETAEEVFRVDWREIGLGVDGCGVPSFHMTLETGARGYAALAHPAAAGLRPGVEAALEAAAEAMTAAPEMVAGPGTFTTRLMQVTGGRVLGKEGAEGLYAVAVRGPVAFGMLAKIADGSERARPGLVLDLLRQMGSLSALELEELQTFHRPPVVNVPGEEVGEVAIDVELEEVGSEEDGLRAMADGSSA